MCKGLIKANLNSNTAPKDSSNQETQATINRLIIKVKKLAETGLASSLDLSELGLTNADLEPLYSNLDLSTANSENPAYVPSEKQLSRQKKIQEIQSEYGFNRVYKLDFSSREEMKKAKKLLKSKPLIESVEEDIKIFKQATVNDPYYNLIDSNPDNLWGIKSLRSADAWDISMGESALVAVLDTGVDYNLRDLWDNLWVNPALISDSNADRKIDINDLDINPRDGKISGTELSSRVRQFVMGYDYINNDSDPMDDHLDLAYRSGGHGTHVAGTIAAIANNNLGVVGVAPKAKIMAMKVLAANGSGDLSAAANAIKQAADNGADVINMSLGAQANTPSFLLDAINYAEALGVAVVVAAGNSGADAARFTPASIPSIITVAALDKNSRAASFSNFGTLIDISAPGVDIISTSASVVRTVNSAEYVRASGTSMACPHVAGVAALIKANEPNLSLEELKQRLRNAFSVPSSNSELISFLRNYFTNRVKPMINSFLAVKNKAVAEISSVSFNTKSVQGTAKADDFGFYELSYLPNLDTASKVSLFKGFSPVLKANLFNNLNLDKSKDNFLILEVFDKSGSRVAFDARRLEPSTLSSASQVIVSVNPNPAQIGQPVLLVASVSGNNPTGTLSFVDTKNPSSLGTINLSGSGNTKSISLNTSFFSLGDRSISATYSGDTKNDPSGSLPISFSVVKANTNTRLSLSSSTAEPNQNISLSASVTGYIPTGKVTFTDLTNKRNLGSIDLNSSTAGNTRSASLSLSFNSIGTRLISATYAGDTNNNPSSSAQFSLNVKSTPTISLRLANSTARVGEQVALAVTVSANPLNKSFPTGTVEFFDNDISIGSVNLSGSGKTSTASLNKVFSLAGERNIKAVYRGDADNNQVSSSILKLNLAKANSSTNLTLSPNPVSIGQQLLIRATVTGINPSGTVSFSDVNTASILGTANLAGTGNSRSADLLITVTSTSLRNIRAAYAGDSNNNSSNSNAGSLSVNKANTTHRLSSSSNSVGLRQSVSFTSTVTGINPSGSVDFVNSANQVLGSVALTGNANSKTAVFTSSFSSAGNQSIRGIYKGDTNNNSSSSNSLDLSVKIAPNISFRLSPSSVNLNENLQAQISLSHSESSSNLVPSGSVEIRDGGLVLGSVNLSPSATKTSSASINIPARLAGSRSINAVYLGDNNFLSVSSSGIPVQVKQASYVGIIPTTVYARAGFQMNILALVSANNPSGAISFTDSNGVNYGTATLQGFGNIKTASVLARFNTKGTYLITANYAGDGQNTPNKSTVLTVNVL